MRQQRKFIALDLRGHVGCAGNLRQIFKMRGIGDVPERRRRGFWPNFGNLNCRLTRFWAFSVQNARRKIRSTVHLKFKNGTPGSANALLSSRTFTPRILLSAAKVVEITRGRHLTRHFVCKGGNLREIRLAFYLEISFPVPKGG